MILLYTYDIAPIMISALFFWSLSVGHRTLVPGKYMSFLQFKQDEDKKKTVQNTTIRIVYLVIGTVILMKVIKFDIKQILFGVFLSSFLNVWPVMVKFHMFKCRKSKKQWCEFLGYVLFVFNSVMTSLFTGKIFIPILMENKEVYWLENQALSFLASLFFIICPITLETVLACVGHVTIKQEINPFLEEIYIIEKQLNTPCKKLKQYEYTIDDISKECDINPVLLNTILYLEIFYRDTWCNRIVEKFMCHYFKTVAINKDISVGIAQIKISTAKKILKKDFHKFMDDLIDEEFNIQVCGKYIKSLIMEYDCEKEYIDKNITIYDYIASKYVGGDLNMRSQTSLIYSAVLRNIMNNKKISYCPSEFRYPCNVVLNTKSIDCLRKIDITDFVGKIKLYGTIQNQFYSPNGFNMEIYCANSYNFQKIENEAKEYNLNVTWS